MKSCQEAVWPLFFEIFVDNNSKLRVEFFSDPLIKFLWNKFRFDYRAQIEEYLKQVVEQEPRDPTRRQKFIEDVCYMELKTGCLILP